jgi:hypothetical protein
MGKTTVIKFAAWPAFFSSPPPAGNLTQIAKIYKSFRILFTSFSIKISKFAVFVFFQL